MKSLKDIEIETKLIVAAADPEAVFDEIQRCESPEGYRLRLAERKILSDTYFDTTGGRLQRSKWAVRVRRIGDATHVALKGPSTNNESGVSTRTEIEGHWNEDLLRRIEVQLNAIDDNYEKMRYSGDPINSFKAAGLRLIQDRETLRITLDAERRSEHSRIGGSAGPIVAQIMLDKVTYHFAKGRIRHHEAEIEAAKDGSEKDVATIAEHLKDTCSGELLGCKWSKLAIGRAIESLLQRRRLVIPDSGTLCLTRKHFTELENILGSM